MKILLTAVLIGICGILETEEDTGITQCRQSSVEGLPAWLLLPLPINPREEKSYVYVTRLARNGVEKAVPVLDGTWNTDKNDVDLTLREPGGSYHFGFYDNKTLLLVITKMSLSHVGTYEVETNPRDPSKAKRSFCNLTMTPQEPDLVDKDSSTLPDQTTSTGTPEVPNLFPVPETVEKLSTSDVSSTLTTANFSIAVLSLVVAALVGIQIVCFIIIWRLASCYLQYKASKDEHWRTQDTSTVRYHSCPTSVDNSSPTVGDPETEQRQALVNIIGQHQDQPDFDIHTPETVPQPADPSRERHQHNNPTEPPEATLRRHNQAVTQEMASGSSIR